MLGYDDFSKLILSYGSFSHKKLQKLSYYVYSWYLTLYGEKIADVNFEAWVHGPVSPEIYSFGIKIMDGKTYLNILVV